MQNNRRKDIYTTGQVAHICKVAPRTVTKWFDNGQLKGYRIPGGKDRRIPAAELLKFMKTHNIPSQQLEMDKVRILIIDENWKAAETLAATLSQNPSYITETASGSFDAGLAVQRMSPHIIFINLNCTDVDAEAICCNIRKNPEMQTTKIAALADGLNQNEAEAVLAKGYDFCITDTSDISQITSAVSKATAII